MLDEVKTTLPYPWSFMAVPGGAGDQYRSDEVHPQHRLDVVGLSRWNPPERTMPALLMTASMRPKCSSAVADRRLRALRGRPPSAHRPRPVPRVR